MTYIELLNNFWKLDRIKPFTVMESKLYFFLLNECNIRQWLNPFELQSLYFAQSLGISRKTIAEVRNRLKQRGLLDVAHTNGRGATAYLLTNVAVSDKTGFRKYFALPTGNTNRVALPTGNANGNAKVTQTVTQELRNDDSHIIDREEKRYKTKDSLSECVSTGSNLWQECCDYFLSDEQSEYRELLRQRYGIDDLSEAFADFRQTLIEEDLMCELHSRQDFARLFKYKYCLASGPRTQQLQSTTTATAITNQSTQLHYETKRDDRLFRRRGVDPAAMRAEDYTTTL